MSDIVPRLVFATAFMLGWALQSRDNRRFRCMARTYLDHGSNRLRWIMAALAYPFILLWIIRPDPLASADLGLPVAVRLLGTLTMVGGLFLGTIALTVSRYKQEEALMLKRFSEEYAQ